MARAESVSHAKMSQAHAGLNDRTAAWTHAREAHRLAETLHRNHSHDPQTQKDLRWAEPNLRNLGC